MNIFVETRETNPDPPEWKTEAFPPGQVEERYQFSESNIEREKRQRVVTVALSKIVTKCISIERNNLVLIKVGRSMGVQSSETNG